VTTVDAHHHFWDPAKAEYPWLTDELAPIRRAFGPSDLEPLLAESLMDATILVQTRSSVDETRDFLALAAKHAFIGGVVGWVDLTAPSVANDLAALRAARGGDRLVGIRHQVHDEPDAEWLSRTDVRRGLRAVGSAGLAYDLLVRARELPAAVDAAAALPDIRFVNDHAAKPPVASRRMEPWAGHLARLASLPNVTCKLSGLVTEADWSSWTPADLRPYVEIVLERFGPERIMFGSDWPVCLLAASYGRVLDTASDLTSELTATERARIFGLTAIETYRLRAS
jgi:L-fucono-1,5-lactonase